LFSPAIIHQNHPPEFSPNGSDLASVDRVPGGCARSRLSGYLKWLHDYIFDARSQSTWWSANRRCRKDQTQSTDVLDFILTPASTITALLAATPFVDFLTSHRQTPGHLQLPNGWKLDAKDRLGYFRSESSKHDRGYASIRLSCRHKPINPVPGILDAFDSCQLDGLMLLDRFVLS
jgi:hypothetical protein